MRTFRNLSYVLMIMTLVSLLMLFPFTQASQPNMTILTFLGVFIAVFAVCLVSLTVSLLMYFHEKNNAVTVVKRRGSRAYGELLRHKTLLISALDGDKHVALWDNFLYDTDEFPRIKMFLGSEFFLLLNCDSFFCNSGAARAYNAFRGLHEELSNFIRSVSYDRAECARFKKHFAISTGKEMTSHTPESMFESEDLAEEWEALQMANEQAIRTIEEILSKIEKFEIAMDKYYTDGTNWKTYKKEIDASYQGWLHDNEV